MAVFDSFQSALWLVYRRLAVLTTGVRPESLKPLDMLTPEDLKTANEQDSFDANLFDLYPDPNHFVQFLRSLNRDDVVPELFIKTLEAYHQSKSSKNNPIK